jgi:hypothetical protein
LSMIRSTQSQLLVSINRVVNVSFGGPTASPGVGVPAGTPDLVIHPDEAPASQVIFGRACAVAPGGVNSPV